MPTFHVVDRAGSTNTDLVAAATADPDAWPHLSVLRAREQTAGKGRAGRTWATADVRALTFSVLLRPNAPRERWGWLPLLAGLAVVRVLRDRTDQPARIGLKWPNDVIDQAGGPQVAGWGHWRKLGGILTEVLPSGRGAVVGIGLNVVAEQLPVPWAGTLEAAGVGTVRLEEDLDALARAISTDLGGLVAGFDDGTDVAVPVTEVCASLGRQVRVDQPGGAVLHGRAVGLADDGGLVVRSGGTDHTVRAGDVQHLRTSE